jgi:sugar lactone lactonase YvrE
MRRQNSPFVFPVALALVLFAPHALLAQYAISTVAGGGPNNLTALSASIGYPGGVALDAAGNTYIADSHSSHIFKVDTTNNLTVVAGNGTHGYAGDGGPATSAALSGPEGVFVDASGNIFIADTQNSVIREVTASNGNIITVAGTGAAGYSGDGGLATSAQLYDPYGVFVDSAENIFIADTDNCLIRKVSGGNISTVVGNPLATPAPCSYSGDGGPATSAQLDEPFGVFVDSSGNIFIADTQNSAIRVVNPGTQPITIAQIVIQSGDIQTVAGISYDSGEGAACMFTGDTGPATSAYLCQPAGVFVDGSENIFIADTANFAIREVATTGTITTVAGTLGTAGYTGDNAAATSATLNYPNSVVVDASSDIFIADTDNFVIREVTASNSFIQTIIGNNTLAYSGDSGLAVNAELSSPASVSIDAAGDIFIADSENSAIREVVAASGDIQTAAGNGTLCALSTALCGDTGLATSAQLNNPQGVFLDASGNIFIADTADNRIRVVNTTTATITVAGIAISSQTIATVAGTGTGGYSGDTGAAISAELSSPYGVFVDSNENIFIADTGNNVIREVSSSGIITTVVGNNTECTPAGATCGDGGAATSAQLSSPAGVFVDATEDIFIADTFDNRIREVTASTGIIATVAGTGARGYSGDGSAATSALLDSPYGVYVDTAGDIFIADTQNFVIREVLAGNIQTVAGNNTQGFSGDGGQSTLAELNSPTGLFGNAAGNLYVADTDNTRIRQLVPALFVTISPNPVSVVVSTQQQFTAVVAGSTNTAVTWSVNGTLGGNSTVGTISTTGLFQAPATIPAPATVTITAVSQADGKTTGSATVTIVSAPTAAQPAPQTISPGGTATYSLLLNANTGAPGQPLTLSCSQASLPPGGSCSFSPAKITPASQAVPFSLTITVPTGSASLATPSGMGLHFYLAFFPLAGLLLASIGPRNKRRQRSRLAGACVFLLMLTACGGSGSSHSSSTNPELGTYNVKVQGATPGQSNPVTITTVGLTVQ